MTYHEESVLNGGPVAHGAEEVFLEGKDHQLLKEAVSHHKLFGGARDVAIVVQNAHACEARDLHLKCHMRGQVDVDLDFASWVSAHVGGPGEGSVEALVPDLVNHF